MQEFESQVVESADNVTSDSPLFFRGSLDSTARAAGTLPWPVQRDSVPNEMYGVVMTIGDMPNREELLEIAPLEALGLLDEAEARRFTLGFDAATNRIQELEGTVGQHAAQLDVSTDRISSNLK